MTDTPEDSSKIGLLMLNLAWIVLLATFFYFFSSLEANRQNPNRDPETTSYEGQKALLLHPNRQDHYVLNGHINGSEVTLLLDTGATNVAVPGDMAAALGLRRGEPIKVMTANGLANGYRTRIDRLQLGDILLTDVADLDAKVDTSRTEAGAQQLRADRRLKAPATT